MVVAVVVGEGVVDALVPVLSHVAHVLAKCEFVIVMSTLHPVRVNCGENETIARSCGRHPSLVISAVTGTMIRWSEGLADPHLAG